LLIAALSTTTALTIIIPVLVAAATLGVGIYTQNQQARRTFELKVAELVMVDISPWGARNRARALKALFADTLPADFAADFNPSDFVGHQSSKRELLKMIAENPGAKDIIVSSWRQLFPDDEWAKDLKV
jgi:hypothetical protein